MDLNEFPSIFQKVKHSHSRHQKTISNLLRINLKGILQFNETWPLEGATVLSVVMFSVSHGVTQIPAGDIVSHGNMVHWTWLFPGCNHRNFQKWVSTTELSRHDVSRGNLCDTVRHGKHYHRQYCMYITLWWNFRGHPNNVSFMQFSRNIDGFRQNDLQGF